MQTEKNTSRINLPRLTKRLLLTVAIIAFVFAMSRPVLAQTTTPTLGRAATFAILGASTVTNVGKTNVTGDVGVSPGTSITGFPPGTVTGGTVHQNNDVASQNAQTDLTVTYNSLLAMPCVTGSANDLTGKDLGGMTLSPGVYCFSSSAGLTGTLHLSGAASAVYIFKIGSTLTTAPHSVVIVDNNLCGGNVFWQVGSSATIDVGTKIAGNIIALASITINTGVAISGRALARTAAVTISGASTITACGAGLPTGGPCDTDTGDTDHHHNDKGETGDNDHHHNGKHIGNNSLRDQARTSHDTDDSHGHHSHHGHNDKDACDNDNENHNNHDSDDRTDNAKDNDD